jgi:hypothetical protein
MLLLNKRVSKIKYTETLVRNKPSTRTTAACYQHKADYVAITVEKWKNSFLKHTTCTREDDQLRRSHEEKMG